MPNNKKSTLKMIKGKDSIHPGSRKAAQLTRVHLRTAKLQSQKKAQKDLRRGKLYRPDFFINLLEGPEALELAALRDLVSEVFLKRHDQRIAELTAERRPGRPKAKELLELEELKRIEGAEWDTGFEVIDLTDSRATRLLYSWVQSGVRLKDAHVDLIPHIRIARENATGIVQSRPGRLDKMGLDGEMPKGEELDIDE